MNRAPLTPDDPRLVALALGEIPDAAERAALEAEVAADPRLAAELAAHRRLAASARTAFAREPLPFVDPAAVAARAMGTEPVRRPSRRSAGLGGSLATPRREKTDTLRFRIFAGAGVAAAACVALFALTRPSGIAPGPAFPAGKSATGPSVAMRAAGPAPATYSARALAGTLPGLRDADGAFRPAGSAALALAAPGARDYVDALSRELAAGRRPAADALRVDGLVNAFVAARPVAPGARPVTLETALTDAPWDPSHRLLRVTVRVRGEGGETVARNAAASVDFDPAGVKSWRILGHGGRVAKTLGATLRAGDTVSTLYEIEPSGDGPVVAVSLRYSPADKTGVETAVAAVAVADRRTLADTDSDTRFAAALAAYALGLGESAATGLAAAAGDDADRKAFAALAR